MSTAPSPKSEVEKLYYAKVDGVPDESDAAAFAEGIVLGDGTKCLPAKLEPLGGGECLVTVMEGKYHQVKRMLAARGKPVTYLRRVRMGNLLLDPALERGTYRLLTKEEWQALAKLTEETGKPRNFNKKESDFLLKKEKTSCNPTK